MSKINNYFPKLILHKISFNNMYCLFFLISNLTIVQFEDLIKIIKNNIYKYLSIIIILL